MRKFIILALTAFSALNACANDGFKRNQPGGKFPLVALKSNLLHDAILILIPCILTVLSSCGHKEIVCPESVEINVMFDWNKASEASVDGMTLFFYPLGEKERIWRFDISGKAGGPVKLPVGNYELIACNNDLPGITLGDTGNAASLYASARRLTEGSDSEVYASTGMLYSAEISRLEVTPCGVRYASDSGETKECNQRVVRCRPDSLSTLYTVNLTNVVGTERIRSASVILEGVSSSILLQSRRPSAIPAALAIGMTVDTEEGRMGGSGCAFAPENYISAEYRLVLQIVLTNGRMISRNIDIHPDNLNIVERHNVIITIDGIVIPDDGSSGDSSGIDAIVDGWDVIVIDVEPAL